MGSWLMSHSCESEHNRKLRLTDYDTEADEWLFRCLDIWEGAKKGQTEQKLY